MKHDADMVDLRELGASVRRGAKWIAAAAAVGLLVALAITLALEPRYRAASTVLVRSGDQAPSVLARLGGIAEGLPGGIRSDLDTELQLLTSRALVAGIVDSLGLQARILEPDTLTPRAVIVKATYPADVRRAVYKFEHDGRGYTVSGPGASGLAVPGAPYRLGTATVVLRRSGLPEEFVVELMGLEEAIDAVQADLTAENPGGDVVQLVFRARDPQTAAAVPNALVTEYLRRRRTTDRGVNQRRFEFLTEQADSIASELVLAEASLRRQQEGSGIIDPEAVGRADLERVMALRTELEGIEVEARALDQIIAQSETGQIPVRQLAAYPTFLRNGAINNLLSRLLELETRRVELLERRTERDPDVVALSKTIESLEAQLAALSGSYRTGLLRQREGLSRELTEYRQEIAAIPGQAQENTRRRRDVARLSETLLALQGQMVEARLAAITEGGEVRLIDPAVAPRHPYFPNPVLNAFGGLLAGGFFGLIGVVIGGQVRRRVYEPWEAELATGLAAVRFDPRMPLSFPALDGVRSVLLLPVGTNGAVVRVGEHMAATAALRGTEVVFTDFVQAGEHTTPAIPPASSGAEIDASELASGATALVPVASANGHGYSVYRRNGTGASAPDLRSTVAELERRFALVVAALPGIDDPSSVSLLVPERTAVMVARGGIPRSELEEAVAVVARLGISTAGIVIDSPQAGGVRRS